MVASEHSEMPGLCSELTRVPSISSGVSQPTLQPIRTALGSWLTDEVTETDCNHLNNSWSPRLWAECLIPVPKPSLQPQELGILLLLLRKPS